MSLMLINQKQKSKYLLRLNIKRICYYSVSAVDGVVITYNISKSVETELMVQICLELIGFYFVNEVK
jgi:hypothetical protein